MSVQVGGGGGGGCGVDADAAAWMQRAPDARPQRLLAAGGGGALCLAVTTTTRHAPPTCSGTADLPAERQTDATRVLDHRPRHAIAVRRHPTEQRRHGPRQTHRAARARVYVVVIVVVVASHASKTTIMND